MQNKRINIYIANHVSAKTNCCLRFMQTNQPTNKRIAWITKWNDETIVKWWLFAHFQYLYFPLFCINENCILIALRGVNPKNQYMNYTYSVACISLYFQATIRMEAVLFCRPAIINRIDQFFFGWSSNGSHRIASHRIELAEL